MKNYFPVVHAENLVKECTETMEGIEQQKNEVVEKSQEVGNNTRQSEEKLRQSDTHINSFIELGRGMRKLLNEVEENFRQSYESKLEQDRQVGKFQLKKTNIQNDIDKFKNRTETNENE